jgi:hypothetical protein
LKKPEKRPEKKKSLKINTGFVAEKNGYVAEKTGKTAEKVCFIAGKIRQFFYKYIKNYEKLNQVIVKNTMLSSNFELIKSTLN